MLNTYDFIVTFWDKTQGTARVQAQTYSGALREVYSNPKIIASDCKAVTLWGGLLVIHPHTPGEYDIIPL